MSEDHDDSEARTPPDGEETADAGGADDPRSVVYDVSVDAGDTGQGSDPGDLNPGGGDALQLRSAVLSGCRAPNVNTRSIEQYDADGDCTAEVTFQSTGQARTISSYVVAPQD